jgi:hypothetical protein
MLKRSAHFLVYFLRALPQKALYIGARPETPGRVSRGYTELRRIYIDFEFLPQLSAATR